MGREGQGAVRRAGYLPRVVLATLVVTVLPGLIAGALQAAGFVHGWVASAGVAVVLSMALAAVGSTWWARRPASRDIVFADLMLWGWLRRVRTERRLASARWLLGRDTDLDPARKAALLERLSGALESRDLYTHGHSRRVTRHSHRIARRLGLSAAEAARIRTAAALHDIGKIETPREVLNKPGRLTDEEFAVIKRHPVDGAKLVAELGDDELTAMVRHHHERLDGGGYPDGLVGAGIPLGARVIAVADTFDALTSNRPYRSGCRHKKALDILRAEAGKQLDPDVVSAFLGYYSGRRALPWWSAVAAAPSRLAAWMLSGVQGATAAPLGGGATSLGAAFLVGATLAGTPATGEAARPGADASPAVVADSGPRGAARDEGEGSGSVRRAERRAAGRAVETPPGSTPPSPPAGVRRLARDLDGSGPPGGRAVELGGYGGGPAVGGGDNAENPGSGSGGSGEGSSGGHDSGGRDSSGGDSGAGAGSGAGDRGLRLADVKVPKLPDVLNDGDDDRAGNGDDDGDDDGDDGRDDGDDGPSPARRLTDVPTVKLPKVDVPKVDVPEVDLPEVEVPKVDLPKVELPKVELPKVEVPKVEVKLPPLEPKLPVRLPPP